MKWLLFILAVVAGAQDRAMLGVAMAEPTYAEVARNYPDIHPLLGVKVDTVVPDSSAAEAGIQTGDYVVALDDRPMSLQSEIFFHVAQRKPGEIVRVRFFRPEAESGDGYAEREVTLGRWQGYSTQRQWSPVGEFIQRMSLLVEARREEWHGWEKLLREYDRDFSWLMDREGLPGARRALECMHDVGVYVKGHELLFEHVRTEGKRWPEYAMLEAVILADRGEMKAALAVTELAVLPHFPKISERRREFLRRCVARLDTPERIRLSRSNPALYEARQLQAYVRNAAPPLRPGESARQPPNCGWLAGFLDLQTLNSLLWAMHENHRYVPGFEDLRDRLFRETDKPHMHDTVAWVYADHGKVAKALAIYKDHVIPFTDDRDYAATLRHFESMQQETQ